MASVAVIPGTVVLPETDRRSALDHVNANWTDMRPKSLIAATEE